MNLRRRLRIIYRVTENNTCEKGDSAGRDAL